MNEETGVYRLSNKNDIYLTIPIKVEVTIETSNPEIQSQFVDYMSNLKDKNGDRIFEETTLVVDTPHAEYIEFGTGPAKPGTKPWPDFVDMIEKWCNIKLGDNFKNRGSGKSLDKLRSERAYAVAQHILKNGIPPQPFFRPALEQVIDEAFAYGDYNNPNNEWSSFEDIAEMLKNEIIRIYNNNRTAYGGPYTNPREKSIEDSIQIRHYAGRNDLITPNTEENTTIPEDIWNNKSVGRNYRPKPTTYGGQ